MPQDVFDEARSRYLAPIEAEGGIAAACANNSCAVMLTDRLVNGAELQQATDGKVIYGFDGQAGSEALFRFNGLPEGVRVTAFVSQDGNPWGYKPGTVVVWFWEGGGKGPTQILNLDNLLRIMADKPNSIQISALDNGLIVTTTDAGGTVIDEQRVLFLPSLPEGYKPLDLEQFPVIRDFLAYTDTVCAPSFSLGGAPEVKLLEKAAGLPKGKLREPEFFDYYVVTTNSFKCRVLLISSEPELPPFWNDNQWGHWQGTVKIIFLTSLDGEAERYIFFPK